MATSTSINGTGRSEAAYDGGVASERERSPAERKRRLRSAAALSAVAIAALGVSGSTGFRAWMKPRGR